VTSERPQNRFKAKKEGRERTMPQIIGAYDTNAQANQAALKQVTASDAGAFTSLHIADERQILTQITDETDPSNVYIGFAAAGSATSAAVWRIMKISIVGSITTKAFADGDIKFDNVWDDRTTEYSYS
jgi:hypothetical protein